MCLEHFFRFAFVCCKQKFLYGKIDICSKGLC